MNENEGQVTFDPNTPEGKAIVEKMIKEQLEAKSKPEAEQKGIDINPEAKGEKPVVKGSRDVDHWMLRGFNSIRSVAFTQSSNVSVRNQWAERQLEYTRQYFEMTDSIRDEEDKEARAIVNAAVSENRITQAAAQRIFNLIDDPLEKKFLSEARTHSGLTGPSGEFVIPKPMLATIYTIIEQYGLAQRLATNVTLSGPGNSLDLNSIATSPTATWFGELELMTESDMVLGENVLTVYELGALSSISNNLQEDSLMPLIPVWLREVGENIALKLDQSWLIGDGTSTYGLMTGLANLANVQSFTAGAGDLAPADIVENDLDQVVRLLTTARRVGAQWIFARILWDYVRKFESTVGARIVQQMLQNLPQQSYDGFPINLSEALDNTNGDVANRDFAILGDYSRSILGTKRGITVSTSTDGVITNSSGVVTLNAFQQNATLVKINLRVGHQTPLHVQDGFAVLNAPAS